jgi:hypothetical protein
MLILFKSINEEKIFIWVAENAPPVAAVWDLLVVSFSFTSIVCRFGECKPPETARIVG